MTGKIGPNISDPNFKLCDDLTKAFLKKMLYTIQLTYAEVAEKTLNGI